MTPEGVVFCVAVAGIVFGSYKGMALLSREPSPASNDKRLKAFANQLREYELKIAVVGKDKAGPPPKAPVMKSEYALQNVPRYRFNKKPMKRWHFLLPCFYLVILALNAGVIFGSVLWAAIFGVPALVLLILGARTDFYEVKVKEHYIDYYTPLYDADRQRQAQATLRPPVWPPRRPDDWGRLEQEVYQAKLKEHNRRAQEFAPYGVHSAPPIMPILPSWEEWLRKEQERDPLQVRWAQNDLGQWVSVQWGNAARLPANGAALPVYQAVRRESDGVWEWVKIGKVDTLSMDWQRGEQQMKRIKISVSDGSTYYAFKPCGSPAHQKAPAPIKPESEHGSSDWQSPDDLAALGAVRPRR